MMNRSPPKSPFDSSDNKPQVSRLQTSSMRSAVDQWQLRAGSPSAYGHNSNNSHNSHNNFQFNSQPFLNTMTYQRVFTPRSSYLSPSLFASNPQMSHNFNNSYNHLYNENQSSNELIETPMRTNTNQLALRAVDRPVYMTPDNNTSEDTPISLDFLRNVSKYFGNNSKIDTKSDPPQSKVNTESNNNRMQQLIEEMKALTDAEHEHKKKRRDVEIKLSQLDEELKQYEQKIQLRSNLRKVKNELNVAEEAFETKKRYLLDQMENHNNSQQIINNELTNNCQKPKDTQISTEITKVDINKKVESTHEKTAPKRATNPSTKSNPNPVKKLKTSEEISSSVRKEINKMAKNESKVTPKHILKKPLITKSMPKPSDGQSPKINRICRQQTQTPTVAKSGVKTSRPQKMLSSRLNPSSVASDSSRLTSNNQKSSESASQQTDDIKRDLNSSKALCDTVSDNEVFEELDQLEKCIGNKDNFSSIVSDKTTNASNTNTSTDTNPIEDIHKSRTEMEETEADKSKQTQQNIDVNENTGQKSVNNFEKSKDNQRKSDKSFESKGVDNNDSNSLKTDKVIEIVEIDDDDEEYETTPEEPIKIKEEKIDGESVPSNEELELAEMERKKKMLKAANGLISDEMKIAMRLKPKTSEGSGDSFSDSSEDQSLNKSNTSNFKDDNEVFKTPVNPPVSAPIKRHKYKYYGIEPQVYPPTVSYSISSFKAIAGPKSKTARTTVIFLKSFKDYLFASFTDCSVRRYHITNKNDVFKYEGHDGFVFSLIIFGSNSSEDTFYLYTGCIDKKLRSFNAITGQLIHCLELNDEILCLDYCWTYIFAGLKDGNLCKVKPIYETLSQTESAINVEKYSVYDHKKISAIKAIGTDATNCEPVLVVSNTKLRIINTISSLKDEERILYSLSVNFFAPVYTQVYEKHLFISYKLPPIKNEDKKKRQDNSRVLVYDLQKDWKPIREIDAKSVITALEVSNKELIITCYSGQIRCIDCEKLELKWIAYNNHLTASVKIQDRLILGNEEGLIDVIYLDGKLIDCDSCGVPFARQVDLKEHIKREHTVENTSSDQQ